MIISNLENNPIFKGRYSGCNANDRIASLVKLRILNTRTKMMDCGYSLKKDFRPGT